MVLAPFRESELPEDRSACCDVPQLSCNVTANFPLNVIDSSDTWRSELAENPKIVLVLILPRSIFACPNGSEVMFRRNSV